MSEFSGPLRALFEKIAPPVDIDRVMGRERIADRRRPGWLVAAAAAAVVLAAGGGWLLLGHLGGSRRRLGQGVRRSGCPRRTRRAGDVVGDSWGAGLGGRGI
jgi:hypothetical protein